MKANFGCMNKVAAHRRIVCSQSYGYQVKQTSILMITYMLYHIQDRAIKAPMQESSPEGHITIEKAFAPTVSCKLSSQKFPEFSVNLRGEDPVVQSKQRRERYIFRRQKVKSLSAVAKVYQPQD